MFVYPPYRPRYLSCDYIARSWRARCAGYFDRVFARDRVSEVVERDPSRTDTETFSRGRCRRDELRRGGPKFAINQERLRQSNGMTRRVFVNYRARWEPLENSNATSSRLIDTFRERVYRRLPPKPRSIGLVRLELNRRRGTDRRRMRAGTHPAACARI